MNYYLGVVKQWLTIATILLAYSTRAQTLAAPDFIGFTACQGADCFEDKVVARGYTPIIGGKVAYAEPGGTNCAENKASYINKGISYTTLDAARYKELVEGFAHMGFTGLLKEGKGINTNSQSAKHPGVWLSIISYPTTDGCGMPCTGYNITVEKK